MPTICPLPFGGGLESRLEGGDIPVRFANIWSPLNRRVPLAAVGPSVLNAPSRETAFPLKENKGLK